MEYLIETNSNEDYVEVIMNEIMQNIDDIKDVGLTDKEIKNMTKTSFELIKRDIENGVNIFDRNELSVLASEIISMIVSVESGCILPKIISVMQRKINSKSIKKEYINILGLLIRYKCIKRHYKCRCGTLFCYKLYHPDLYDFD
jgi:hypothetical protein